MFVDAATVAAGTTLRHDLCVVGAGAAGITIAREFLGSGRDVCLLESGGFEMEERTSDLYRGEVDGPDVDAGYLTRTRLRVFGGSMMAWGGMCRPMDEIDFEAKPWLPDYPAWPFTRSALIPHYERAARMLAVAPFFSGQAVDQDPFPVRKSGLVSVPFHFSPPIYPGSEFRGDFEKETNLRVVLHANALEFLPSATGDHIDRLRVVGGEGREFTVKARTFVLCAGGIETPRILLQSNSVLPAGIGNRHDLVGRFFMSHFPHSPGRILMIDPTPGKLLGRLTEPVIRYLCLDEEVRRRMKLVSSGIMVHPSLSPGFTGRHPDAMDKVLPFFEGLFLGRAYYLTIPLLAVPEQVPNRESRIVLGEERDFTGMRRVKLRFRRSPIDTESFRTTLAQIGRTLGRLDIGRLQSAFSTDAAPPLVPDDHHMGATRMHDDPRHGVVNADCRVHGIDNLYVSGPSVFPSGGFANPVMTIVAMAMRLADHLKGAGRAQ
jgi:choline dehydrogenase-like flavoprotein